MDEKDEKNLEKVGAFWQNLSEQGNIYFNIDIAGKKYIGLQNNFKEEEKQPDFIIYERTKK